MNYTYYWNRLKHEIGNRLFDMHFLCFQKPMLLLDRKNLFKIGGKLRNCKIIINGTNNNIIIEKGCVLNKVFIEITGSRNTLILHKNVAMPEGGRLRLEDFDNTIEVQDNTTLINVFLSSADHDTKLTIGKNCLFSSDVIIRTSDSHSILNQEGERINPGNNVSIGDHTWICNGVRIMKGTNIGSECVVGSNTMIAGMKTGNHELIIGNPAKTAKTDIQWKKERI